jgi:hypothetical protein
MFDCFYIERSLELLAPKSLCGAPKLADLRLSVSAIVTLRLCEYDLGDDDFDDSFSAPSEDFRPSEAVKAR